jgi:hypothetical protein
MKKILGIVVLGLLLSGNAYAENKDNNHLENKFESYRSCQDHVAVLFSQTDYKRDYPYLFPENKLVSCNPEINLPNEWTKTITTINKFARVKLDNARVRAYPFVGHRPGIHVGHLQKDELIFIDSLIFTSLEEEDEWYRSWYSFKVNGKIFYIWKDSVELK